MKNIKKLLIIAFAVIMAFSMTGCDDWFGTDTISCPLNGNWDIRIESGEGSSKATLVTSYWLSNGNWENGIWAVQGEREFTDDDYTGAFKGTYSRSSSEVIMTTTHFWAMSMFSIIPGIEPKWYTESDFRSLLDEIALLGLDKWITDMFTAKTYTYMLSNDGNTLTLQRKSDTPSSPDVYTKRVGARPQTGGSTPPAGEVRRDFTTAGQHTFTYSEGFPATVHVYMLGAGGGGQGGHTKDYAGIPVRTERGTGAAGGGGAALYASFTVTSAATFNITVGAGGTGGARLQKGVGGSWESGHPGTVGGDTTITFDTLNLTAQGGRGGGGTADQAIGGGVGGTAATRPTSGLVLSNWTAMPGSTGGAGRHNADLRSTQNRGAATGIPSGNGPGAPFGGSLPDGSLVPGGHGGLGGHGANAGNPGDPGRVLFVVTRN